MKKTHPNPQGKGLVPVLDSLKLSRSLRPPAAKPLSRISSELFTSLFVLHSQFQFKPVVGQPYWLYRCNKKYRLSLISPQEWKDSSFGVYIGECVLQDDITWSLKLDEDAVSDSRLMADIKRRREAFEQTLTMAKSIETALPYYLPSLPFHQRVFAAALASSLQGTLVKSGMQGLSYHQAKRLQIKS